MRCSAMPKAGLLAAALIALAAPTVAVQAQSRSNAAEPSVLAEARAFMAAYAGDLRGGNRAAIAARYNRGGAWLLGNGEKRFETYAAIQAHYAGPDWAPPVSFEWRDLSYLSAGPNAVVVAGTFLWGPDAATPPRRYSYTGFLTRQDGVLRIRLEDESAAPR